MERFDFLWDIWLCFTLIVHHIQVDLTLEETRMAAKSRNLFSYFVYLKSCAPLECAFFLRSSFFFAANC